MTGINPEIKPLPEPPRPAGTGSSPRRPARSERMGGEHPPAPATPDRGALVPPELDLVDPDAGNSTDTVTLRMRQQHVTYFAGLRDSVSIRYGVSKRIVDEAIVLLVRKHRDELIEMVSPLTRPEKVVDIDKFLGDQ